MSLVPALVAVLAATGGSPGAANSWPVSLISLAATLISVSWYTSYARFCCQEDWTLTLFPKGHWPLIGRFVVVATLVGLATILAIGAYLAVTAQTWPQTVAALEGEHFLPILLQLSGLFGLIVFLSVLVNRLLPWVFAPNLGAALSWKQSLSAARTASAVWLSVRLLGVSLLAVLPLAVVTALLLWATAGDPGTGTLGAAAGAALFLLIGAPLMHSVVVAITIRLMVAYARQHIPVEAYHLDIDLSEGAQQRQPAPGEGRVRAAGGDEAR